ncbi:MAG: ribosome biogenesis GTP-binding protein YihA/YsxC [Pseudomonadota bacterium]
MTRSPGAAPPAVPFTVAPNPEPAEAEDGRRLFAGPCDFVKGVVALSGLPAGDRPEVCFAGRSNAGKSSLINALTGRNSLARASNTPGRTQEINYFALGERLYLVDLPGYGFAEAPKEKVARWQELLRSYLAGRAGLARAYVLIDGRHGVKAADHDIMDLLDRAAVSFQAVITKADKPKAAALETVLAAVARDLSRHPAAYPEVIVTSSQDGRGLPALRRAIESLA